MCMCLGAATVRVRTISPHFASLIARRTYLIKSPMGSRQGVRLRQCPLAGGSPGSVYIGDYPLRAWTPQTIHQGRQTVCVQADPPERVNEALPRWLDPGPQESGRASSDGEADAR